MNFRIISPHLPQIFSDYCSKSLGESRDKQKGFPVLQCCDIISSCSQTGLLGRDCHCHHLRHCCGCIPMPIPWPLSKWRHTCLSPVSALVLGYRAHLTFLCTLFLAKTNNAGLSSSCDFGFGLCGQQHMQAEDPPATSPCCSENHSPLKPLP